MGLVILTPAATTGLVIRTAVKDELKIAPTDTSYDSRLDRWIAEATDSITRACHLPSFARQQYRETLPGSGRSFLVLSGTPIAAVTSITNAGAAITDYSILDAERGFLYREGGWDWTRTFTMGNEWHGPVLAYPNPRFTRPDFSVDYDGGYWLPGDNYTATTLSFAATDNSVNDSAGGVPRLVAGERLTIANATTAGNNGVCTVVSRTASKLIVSGLTFTTAAAGAAVSLTIRTLPSSVERAAFLEVKAMKEQSGRDATITHERIADRDVTVSYAQRAKSGLMPESERLLTTFLRAV